MENIKDSFYLFFGVAQRELSLDDDNQLISCEFTFIFTKLSEFPGLVTVIVDSVIGGDFKGLAMKTFGNGMTFWRMAVREFTHVCIQTKEMKRALRQL